MNENEKKQTNKIESNENTQNNTQTPVEQSGQSNILGIISTFLSVLALMIAAIGLFLPQKLANEIDKQFKNVYAHIQTLSANVNNLGSKVNSLEKQIYQINMALDKLPEKFVTIDKFETLKERVNENSRKIEANSIALAKVSSTISSLSQNVLSITKKFDNITAKVNFIYQEISSLKNSINALNKGFEILQKKQNDLEKQVAQIKEEVKRKQDVILRPVKLIGIIPSRTGDYIYIFDVAGKTVFAKPGMVIDKRTNEIFIKDTGKDIVTNYRTIPYAPEIKLNAHIKKKETFNSNQRKENKNEIQDEKEKK